MIDLQQVERAIYYAVNDETYIFCNCILYAKKERNSPSSFRETDE